MPEIVQINCSAGRGVMPKTDCLNCALAGANTCGYDYSLLVYLLNDPERTGIHVTDLTGCIRKAFYHRTREQVEFIHEMLVRKLGTAVHSKLERQDPNFVAELELDALGIVGRADVYYDNGRILDYKTTRWLTPSKLPYGSHIEQVNIYAALLREMGMPVTSAAIQYIDLSGPTKCKRCNRAYMPVDGILACPKCGASSGEAHLGAVIFEIQLYPHDEVVNKIIERRDALSTALESGNTPLAEEGFLCNYCPFTEICSQEK
jgi:CRISPR/Cas system-associated exonuclease Cas4 (RecB family)